MQAERVVDDARMHRHGFDQLATLPARRVEARIATDAELPQLIALAGREIPGLLAAEAAVRRAFAKHPASIWGFWRDQTLVGVYAMLFINQAGFPTLLAEHFDYGNPPDGFLAGTDDDISAIYKWAVYCPGLASEGMRTVSRHLLTPQFAKADLFARPTNEQAWRLDLNLGFRPLQEGSTLVRYVRVANRPAAAAA